MLGPKGSYTYYRDVDAVEENLKKIVLEKTECVNQSKKQMFLKFGHFAPMVLMLRNIC